MIRARDLCSRALVPRDHSGPAVARLFHRLLGAHLPRRVALARRAGPRAHRRARPPPRSPSSSRAPAHAALVRRFPDAVLARRRRTRTLIAGIVIGVVLSLVAAVGAGRASLAAAQVALYLSYVIVGAHLPRFQWDNLLLECGFFAVFLPRDAPRRRCTLLFRLVLFKLYFESGIAKWQSPLHDWQDGSAMTYYYETAPLPTCARLVRAPPARRGGTTSRAGRRSCFELVRAVRHLRARAACASSAAAFLTGFQIVNTATANYGFFCYLAVALHVFLLDDSDVERAAAYWCAARLAPCAAPRAAARRALLAGAGRRSLGRSVLRERVLRRGLAGQTRSSASPTPTALFAALDARCATLLRRLPPRQHLPPVRAHHARAHRARVPDHRRRRAPGPRTTSATSRAIRSAAPTSSRRTSRASTSSSGSTASRYRSGAAGLRDDADRAPVPRPRGGPAAVSRAARAAPRRRAHRLLAISLHHRRRAARHRRLVEARARRRHRRSSVRHAFPRPRRNRPRVIALTQDCRRGSVSRRHEAHPRYL